MIYEMSWNQEFLLMILKFLRLLNVVMQMQGLTLLKEALKKVGNY